jgi:hypothetical protein
MHVPYEAQIVLVPRCLAYRLPPFFDQLEDSILHARRMHRRALWKSANEFVEKFLGADLKMESVSAVLNTDIEELYHGELCVDCSGGSASYIECEEGHVLVAVVDVIDYCNGCFARSAHW